MALLETCLWHVSDAITWIDASLDTRPGLPATLQAPLAVRLGAPSPRDLKLVQKPGRTLLWRSEPEALRQTRPGPVDFNGRRRPAVPGYEVAGQAADPLGRFLPRRFSITAGGQTPPLHGHVLPLYRSPAAVDFRSGGGLFGHLLFEDGMPAAGALLALTVTPPEGPGLAFVAQADRRGEFRLAWSALPQMPLDAPPYPAQLAVRASRPAAQAWLHRAEAVDPARLPVARIQAAPVLQIFPDRAMRLASVGQQALIVIVPPGPPGP